MSVYDKIEKLLGRKLEFNETDYHGKHGFFPVYVNYNFQSRIADMFSEEKDECAHKFLDYLESIQGDTNANNPINSIDDRGSISDSGEDQSS